MGYWNKPNKIKLGSIFLILFALLDINNKRHIHFVEGVKVFTLFVWYAFDRTHFVLIFIEITLEMVVYTYLLYKY